VVVVYQPDELCIVGNRLYVANSGGYRVPDYDHTVSVINLSTFREERKIDVAINLHRCRADQYGQLWVTSRGDYFGQGSNIYWLSPDENGQMQPQGSLGMAVSDLCIVGDSLYFYGADFNFLTMENQITYGIINVRTHQVVTTELSQAPEVKNIEMPYGIIVNPLERDFYLMDAKNYVSSGQLLHFRKDGTFDYSVWTGDIPAHAAFVFKQTNNP
jgi:DNA-binding beta-propeller fold protein YncE